MKVIPLQNDCPKSGLYLGYLNRTPVHFGGRVIRIFLKGLQFGVGSK